MIQALAKQYFPSKTKVTNLGYANWCKVESDVKWERTNKIVFVHLWLGRQGWGGLEIAPALLFVEVTEA